MDRFKSHNAILICLLLTVNVQSFHSKLLNATWHIQILENFLCPVRISTDDDDFQMKMSEVKWSAYSRWSFRPNFAWGSIRTMIIRKTHPTLIKVYHKISGLKYDFSWRIINQWWWISLACFVILVLTND